MTEPERGTRQDGSSACAASSMTTVSNGTDTFLNTELPVKASVEKTTSALFRMRSAAASLCMHERHCEGAAGEGGGLACSGDPPVGERVEQCAAAVLSRRSSKL